MQNFLASIFVLLGTVSPGTETRQIPITQWVPTMQDEFIVDTQANMGYLVHSNGLYTSFRVGSGQRKTVTYGGNTYFAATPVREWTIMSKDIQTDRITFAANGHFLRMYINEGKTETPYGIHATANIAVILAREDRYASMGCVLVSDVMMQVMEKTFEINGGKLKVTTVDGLATLKKESAIRL